MSTKEIIHSFFKNRVGILATMHRKEEVISPILEKELGIKVIVPENFNSDQFGTFTGDIERIGNQFEAARHKARGSMELYGETLAFASEGSFGPHPLIPVLPFNREIILLIDKENDMEIIGTATTTETNFNQKAVKTFKEAYDFSLSVGFPEHAVVIKAEKTLWRETKIIKGITTKKDLEDSFNYALKNSRNNEVSIESDMRALYNPTRMKNIKTATVDLVKNIYNLCPKCSWPGFKLIETKKGLPCSWCKLPTQLILSHQYNCHKCGYTEEKLYPNGIEQADPGQCQYCNP